MILKMLDAEDEWKAYISIPDKTITTKTTEFDDA